MHSSKVVALWSFVILCILASVASPLWAQSSSLASVTQPWQPPRTPDGKPDLQGTWTNNTATPLVRPKEYADKRYFTEAEAAEFERSWLARLLRVISDTDRQTAGDLSEDWFDRAKVVPDRRTSLVIDPENGLLPPRVKAADERRAARQPMNYDDPESRSLGERCLLGDDVGGESVTPPIVPNPFAFNYYRIVQTATHVLIFGELVHDARVIRIGGTHLPRGLQQWLGDSVGRWEGDALVVDTTNISEKVHFAGATGGIHVVERFTRTGPSTITYRATVDDPNTWSAPWTMEVPFSTTEERLFEYACHEANYSMAGALRGARAQEKDQKPDR